MLKPIPALSDNYIWVYGKENLPVIIVDIAETTQLLPFLQSQKLEVEAVFLTHFHDDHTAGVAEFLRHYPNVPVYGSKETQNCGATQIISEGNLSLPHYDIQVIHTAGHTAEHLSFVVDNHLFCGDTLFSAGCGRVFTGDYQAMWQSMQKLKALPSETLVCAGHEYTLSNLKFAIAVAEEQQSAVLKNRVLAEIKRVEQCREVNQPSLPTILAQEFEINPFLWAENQAEFTRLRQWKDHF